MIIVVVIIVGGAVHCVLSDHNTPTTGLIKIVPPSSWSCGFGINKADLTFRTRKQRVTKLNRRQYDIYRARFIDRYNLYLNQRDSDGNTKGKTRIKFPPFCGVSLDAYSLYKGVKDMGGSENVRSC